MDIKEKVCKICGELKEIKEYYSSIRINKDGDSYIWYNTTCKKCYIKRQGIWVDANLEKHNGYYKKYHNTKNKYNEKRIKEVKK